MLQEKQCLRKARFLIGGSRIQPAERAPERMLKTREKKEQGKKKKKGKEIVKSKSHLANARGAEETEADAAATREDDANSIWLAIVWLQGVGEERERGKRDEESEEKS